MSRCFQQTNSKRQYAASPLYLFKLDLLPVRKVNIWQTCADIFPQDLVEHGERLHFSDNNNEKNIGFLSSRFVGNK